jgi:acetyltransferase-like isoleucine patch superfamily enzyme
MIADTAVIHEHVRLGENVIIGDYCIIGLPFSNRGDELTIIGNNAVIRSHTVIYAGNSIGCNFQTGHHVNIRELNQIGDNVSVGTSSVIEHHIKIEDEVRIHSQVFIPEYSMLLRSAWIGPNVVLTNALYPRSQKAKKFLKGPVIEEDAKIGGNSTILPGVIIGRNSLIGAGSVVTKDIPINTVAVGNPATVIKSINDLPYDFDGNTIRKP